MPTRAGERQEGSATHETQAVSSGLLGASSLDPLFESVGPCPELLALFVSVVQPFKPFFFWRCRFSSALTRRAREVVAAIDLRMMATSRPWRSPSARSLSERTRPWACLPALNGRPRLGWLRLHRNVSVRARVLTGRSIFEIC